MTYHVLRTRGGSELTIKDRLERRGIASTVPSETVATVRRGRKIEQEKPLVSRYVFAEGTVDQAKAVPGVHDVLRHADGRAVQIEPEILERMQAPARPEVANGVRLVGKRVRITRGAFQGFDATVKVVRKARAHLDVRMFGQPTPVDLPIEWLELLEG